MPRLSARAVAAARLLVGAAAIALLAGCSGSDEPLWLGLALPVTDTEGSPDVYGETSRLGAELALEEINQGGGIGGRPLRFRTVNDRGDDSTAIVVADSLARDERVLAVVGHVYSGVTLKAAPLYEQAGLAALATTATSPEISALGPWIFRMTSSDSVNAVELARVAREMNLPTAVLYANDDYGLGLMRSFERAFLAAGAAPVQTDPYLEDTPDFRPYLARLREKGARLVFVAGIDQGAATLIPQAREVGLDARFMGGDGIEALAGAGAGFDGTLVGMLFHPDASEASRKFSAAYRARYGREPDSSAALAYDAVQLLARALRDGASTREEVRRYLERVGREGGSPRFEGAAGPVAFDAAGDPRGKTCVVGVIRGGRIVLPTARG